MDVVEHFIYPRMRRFIYGTSTPYITKDERKLTESDIRTVCDTLAPNPSIKYFNFIVSRLLPDKWAWAARVDRCILLLLGSLGRFLAGRILVVGHNEKEPRAQHFRS